MPPLGEAITKGKAKFVDQVMEHGVHKEGVRAYLAATAYADAQMGRVLDALEKSDYRDNTIVMLMSDNGFHLGEKHHWQKSTLWEEATHCLLMFRVPGMTKAGGTCERFVSLQDVYRTLTELCGLKAPDYVAGRSLVPLLKQPDARMGKHGHHRLRRQLHHDSERTVPLHSLSRRSGGILRLLEGST